MNYISYLIKCVIRRLVYIFVKPKYIVTLIVSMALFLFLRSGFFVKI